jgi:2-aminoadipate transaminase
LINFDQGLPDPRLFPVATIERCFATVLREDGEDALRYFGSGGAEEMQWGAIGLRAQLAAWTARRDGVARDSGGVLLVNGSTDGLSLAVNTFLGRGDGAVVEAATYPHTRRFMVATGAEVRTVPMDHDGMDVDALDGVLQRLHDDGHPPKLVYTIPTFHAPTGTVLPLARRRQLLEVARRWGVILLEDNCYYEFAYDDPPPPPTLLALDARDAADDARAGATVVQSDSFSKYIAPGLRMAWLAGAPPLLRRLAATRQDFAVSRLVARALEHYMAEGHLDPHLAELRTHYRAKRDRTVAALRAHCEPLVRFQVPSGGFFLWLELAPEVDWERARREVAARGVALRPGDGMLADDDDRRFVRLSCIQVPTEDIETGIRALGDALHASVGVR